MVWLTAEAFDKACKKLQSIVESTPALKYIIELGAAGRNTDEDCATDIAAQEIFRKTQRAYMNPTVCSGPIQQLSCAPLDHKHWNTRPRFAGDVATFVSTSLDTLGVVSLRSDIPERKRFRELRFDFKIEQWFISLVQDVLILVECQKLHIRTFSTNQIPKQCIALGRQTVPVLGNDISSIIRDWESISIWKDFMLVCVLVQSEDGDPTRHKILFHWPTGQKIAVSR